MIFLQWFCFMLVCIDVVDRSVQQAENIRNEFGLYNKIKGHIGLLISIAARIYVLCGAAAYWLWS